MLLGYLVYGPWKDPQGYNFPADDHLPARDRDAAAVSPGTASTSALLLALGGAVATWLFLFRTYAGFQLAIGGVAPRAAPLRRVLGAARRCGRRCSLSGGVAGLAGALEVAGPLGQLTPHLPVGYGFAAIIVAFVGRLHPFGIVLSALLMSMLYIGGELAQSRLGLPKALTGVFQGLLLFTLLACDAMAQHRIVRIAPRVKAAAPPRQEAA